jgi:CHAT domain-containing protein
MSLNNLANVLADQGDYAGARPLHERALQIREAALGPEHPNVAMSLNNLANVLLGQGDDAGARPLHERALAIREAALGPEHPDVANSLNNLALVLRDRGDDAGARPLYERALAIWEVALGPEHPAVARSLNNLAILLADQGDDAGAWELVQRVAAGRASHLGVALASLTEGESFLYLARSRKQLEFQLSVAGRLAAPAVEIDAYGAVLRWKGRVARLLLASREQLRAELTDAQRDLVEQLRGLQARLSRLVLSEDIRDREAHDAEVAAVREMRDDVERRLRRSVQVAGGVEVSVAEVLADLPARSAVVDFFVHRVYEPAQFDEGGEFVRKGDWTEPHLSAWIVRADRGGVVRLDLGPTAPMEAATRAFLEDLVLRRGISLGDTLPPGQEPLDLNTELRSQLWDPIAEHLAGVETVFVSPDGFVGTFPFEVLRSEDGRFLIEDHAFVYTGDVTSLARLGGAEALLADKLLAVGGVDFGKRAALTDGLEDSDSPGAAPRNRSSQPSGANLTLRSFAEYWGRLPATKYESQVVFDMHTDAIGERGHRVLLQGEAATEEALKAQLSQVHVAHLATHGYFQPDGMPSMWAAALDAASGEQRMEMTEGSKRLVGLHPGLLSGLVCAGANTPAEEDRDDGYLTAEEVTWLDLSGVELVVLSACDTGLGRPQSGEGLIGLRRAFRTAGAKTVISSLWSVKDESTSVLMQSFYANLFFKGLGRHEALRSAQLKMLQANRREFGTGLPSTWGPFVLSGEWR